MEMVQFGCLTLGRSYAITLTFRRGSVGLRDAPYVERVWRAFCRRFRKKFKFESHLKVLELTKMGQPHFHLIVGGIGTIRPHCRRTKLQTVKHLVGNCRLDEECLEHVISRMWLDSTRDSPIVYATMVHAPKGLGRYLGKYLTKTFTGELDAAELGFGRRWSVSRNWPRVPQMQLQGSVDSSWTEVRFASGTRMAKWKAEQYLVEMEETGDFVRVGTELAEKMNDHKIKKQRQMLAERVLNGNRGEHAQDGSVPGS